jgi:hypothetical protein
MTNCDQHREENPKLTGVECCAHCHSIPEEIKRPIDWVCCKIWNMENTYRPPTRPVSPLRS